MFGHNRASENEVAVKHEVRVMELVEGCGVLPVVRMVVVELDVMKVYVVELDVVELVHVE